MEDAAISAVHQVSAMDGGPEGDCPLTRAPTPRSDGPAKRRNRRYRCLNANCDRRFISEYTRKVHMDGVHNPKPRKMLACSMGCGELFGRRHDRLRHEVAQHGKVSPQFDLRSFMHSGSDILRRTIGLRILVPGLRTLLLVC